MGLYYTVLTQFGPISQPPTVLISNDVARPMMTPTSIYPLLSSVFAPIDSTPILPPVVPAMIPASSMQPYQFSMIIPPPFAYIPLPQRPYQLFNAFGLPNFATGLQSPPLSLFMSLNNNAALQPVNNFNDQRFGELLGAFGEDLDAN